MYLTAFSGPVWSVQARRWSWGMASPLEHGWPAKGAALGPSNGHFSFAHSFHQNHGIHSLTKSFLFPCICSDPLMRLGLLFFPEMWNICPLHTLAFCLFLQTRRRELHRCLFLFCCWLIWFSTRVLLWEKINITGKILVYFKYVVSFLYWEY